MNKEGIEEEDRVVEGACWLVLVEENMELLRHQ